MAMAFLLLVIRLWRPHKERPLGDRLFLCLLHFWPGAGRLQQQSGSAMSLKPECSANADTDGEALT